MDIMVEILAPKRMAEWLLDSFSVSLIRLDMAMYLYSNIAFHRQGVEFCMELVSGALVHR